MSGRPVPSEAADRAVEPAFSVSTLTREPGSGSPPTGMWGGRSQPGITPRRGWLVRRALLVADVCGLILAFAATELLLGSPDGSGSFQQLTAIGEVAIFCLTLPLWILLAKLYGLYDRDEERPAHTTVDDLIGVVHLTTIGLWSVTVGAWLTHLIAPDFAKLVFFWILAVTFIVLARCVARATVRRTGAYRQRTLIVGADRSARLLAEKLSRHPESGIDVIACVSEQPNDRLDSIPVVGAPEDVLSIVSELDIERVIFARLDEAEVSTIIRPLRSTDVQVDMVVRPLEAVAPDTRVHMLDGIPILGISPARLSHSSLLLKRTIDVALSGIALVLLSPVLAVIALLIKLDSRGPVLYRHDRIGRDWEPFRLLKFRTMQAKYCRGNGYGGEAAEAGVRPPDGRSGPAAGIREPLQALEGSTGNADRALSSANIIGRAPPAIQRLARRPEPRRTKTHRGCRGRALWVRRSRRSVITSRCHRLLAGERPLGYELSRESPTGHGLRQQLVASARFVHPAAHGPSSVSVEPWRLLRSGALLKALHERFVRRQHRLGSESPLRKFPAVPPKDLLPPDIPL